MLAQSWQENHASRLFCHWWQDRHRRKLTAMTAILLILFVTSLVYAVERHHRRTSSGLGLPQAPHGADSTIAFTDLDHETDRVLHDVLARA